MNKTRFNVTNDSGYVSPAIESCQLLLDTCILTSSTMGTAEGYWTEELDDLWM